MGNSIAILHDSFARRPGLHKDWGFAAVLEFRGKRMLFDTGNNARILAENTKPLAAAAATSFLP